MPDESEIYRERLYENRGLPALVAMVDPSHKRLLDLGCGNGANMRLLREKGHEVTGVTLSEAEVAHCRQDGFESHLADITAPLPFEKESFDGIILCHVLEHLAWPQQNLQQMLQYVRPGGGVYIALPNVLFISQRLQFLFGRFRYAETGIMDRTHLRFYDFNSAREMLESIGLRIVEHQGDGVLPQPVIRRFLPGLAARLDRRAAAKFPGIFAINILFSARRTA